MRDEQAASVFHQVIDLVPGTDALQPAGALRDLDPDAYAQAMRKYEGSTARRRLKETWVPRIGRLWTEVVFLSPIHPHAIWTAWREISGEHLPSMQFWSIPVDDLPLDAVVFDRTTSEAGEPIADSEVRGFDRARFRAASRTPAAHRLWLEELAARGGRGAWFNRTPHVLTAGPVTLRNATTIDWATPPSRNEAE